MYMQVCTYILHPYIQLQNHHKPLVFQQRHVCETQEKQPSWQCKGAAQSPHSVLPTPDLARPVVLQCVAVWLKVLQYVAVCCGVLQCVAVCCSVLQCVAVYCSVL